MGLSGMGHLTPLAEPHFTLGASGQDAQTTAIIQPAIRCWASDTGEERR